MNTPKFKMEKPNGLPVLSFFTGAGFLDLGFLSEGFDIAWSNEFNPHFSKGYKAAFAGLLKKGRSHGFHHEGSITHAGPNQIIHEAFGGKTPKEFGVIGGPPCPDFSVGGKNRGGKGLNGRLSLVYVDRIIELRPTFFLFENVPGLLRTAKHREFLTRLKNKLDADYVFDQRVLNALHYGAPQDRQRLILIGFRKDWFKKNKREIPISESNWFPWPTEKFPQAKTRYEWPGRDKFGGTPIKPADIPDELMAGTYIGDLKKISRLPNGKEGFKPYSRRFKEVDEGDDSRKCFKRLHRWRFSPTAAYGNNEVHLHPTEPRRLTVREALLLQTVPNEYVLPAELPLSHKFKMIGNGVPVLLARKLAGSIAAFMETECP